jgi:hypothetical protein
LVWFGLVCSFVCLFVCLFFLKRFCIDSFIFFILVIIALTLAHF